MKFGLMNKVTTIMNRLVLRTLYRNIKRLATITRKTAIKFENSKKRR